MRRLAVAVVAAFALVGCTPTNEPPPTPTVEQTPTKPAFTESEQAVIGAVDRYLERLAQIARDPVGEDWNTIRDVAWDPAANDALIVYRALFENGLHLEGMPVFEPEAVMNSSWDHEGQRYHIYGCQSLEGPYVVDGEGNPVGRREFERTAYWYEVVLTPDGQYFVARDESEEREC